MKRRILLTDHARERLARVEACDDPARLVRQEVAAALREGRTAVRCPRWLRNPSGYRSSARPRGAQHQVPGMCGTRRFVWNREETRGYLVNLSHADRAVVVTIIARREAA